jgi:hypothetical protein
MGTRSEIAVENKDGTFTGIYCHWDGYPGHVGKILFEFYSDLPKLRKLMKLGSLSVLGGDLGKKHNFDQTAPREESTLPRTIQPLVKPATVGACTAYIRDRGESKEENCAVKYDSLKSLMEHWSDRGAAYLYVWRQSNQWEFARENAASHDMLIPLEPWISPSETFEGK